MQLYIPCSLHVYRLPFFGLNLLSTFCKQNHCILKKLSTLFCPCMAKNAEMHENHSNISAKKLPSHLFFNFYMTVTL